jgi:ketosteroid isomerase-like protein
MERRQGSQDDEEAEEGDDRGPEWSTFALTRVAVLALADDPERIVAEFASDGTLVGGSPYRNRYLALGMVRDGLIQHWTEFSDPAALQRGFAGLHADTPVVNGRLSQGVSSTPGAR